MTKQIGRYSNDEKSLIEANFKENDDLLYAIRKVFFQKELTDNEVKLLQVSLKGKTLDILQKQIVPNDLETLHVPFFNINDMYFGLYSDMKERIPETTYQLILAKDLEFDYLTQQFNALVGVIDGKKVKTPIKFAELTSREGTLEERYIKITARNFLLSYIDSALNNLKIIAGNEEAKADLMARVAKNSTK